MLSFHVKFVQTDRWTTVKQYAPDLSIWSIKNAFKNSMGIHSEVKIYQRIPGFYEPRKVTF